MIPYAILSGKVFFSDGNEIDIRILDLAVDSFTFRLAKRYAGKEISRISLKFYQFDKCIWNEVLLVTGEDMEVNNVQTYYYLTDQQESSKNTTQFFNLYEIRIKNAKSEEYTRILTSEYIKYIELKLAGDDGALSKEFVRYPAELDSTFPKSVKEWRANCLDDVKYDLTSCLAESIAVDHLEISLNLNTPAIVKKYLEMDWIDFLTYVENTFYLGKIHIAPSKVGRSHMTISSIYIGNQLDSRLLPDKKLLKQILKKSEALRLKTILQFPPMKESLIDDYKSLLEIFIEEANVFLTATPEIVINDIGLCEFVKEEFSHQFDITLGILLNKRRKDVRLPYKKGYSEQMHLLKLNSLNADFTRAMYLERYGIKKYSYESCEYPYTFAGQGHVLHLPYFQMNTGGSANHSTEEYRLYPTHLHMIGKNNSLFGYDRRILADPEYLDSLLQQKPARIVLEFI